MTVVEPTAELGARERILESAYELFSKRRVGAVGIDELIDRASVAKATLYRHFPSKDDLVLAFLRRREERWTKGWVEAEATASRLDAGGELLAIFDLFDEWFRRDDFEGCSFVNVLLETADLTNPVGRRERGAPREHPRRRTHACRGGRPSRPEAFARSWHILMKGSIVQAAEGDLDAAKRAQRWARVDRVVPLVLK